MRDYLVFRDCEFVRVEHLPNRKSEERSSVEMKKKNFRKRSSIQEEEEAEGKGELVKSDDDEQERRYIFLFCLLNKTKQTNNFDLLT